MKELKVKEILKICNAELLSGSEEEVLENFKKDTNEIQEGDTYIGIQGERVNRKYIFWNSFLNESKSGNCPRYRNK